MKPVNPFTARLENWCARNLFHPCPCIFGMTRKTRAIWPVTSKCIQQDMAANPVAVTPTLLGAVFGGTAIGCELVHPTKGARAVKAA